MRKMSASTSGSGVVRLVVVEVAGRRRWRRE